MPDQVATYVFTSDRQAVLDAMTGILPKEQWRTLPNSAKALLAAVVVLCNKEKYCDDEGYLKMLLIDLFRELSYLQHEYQTRSLRAFLASRNMLDTNGLPSTQRRMRFLVIPAVQECLDDLARCNQLKKPSSCLSAQERADQIIREVGEDGAKELIHELNERLACCASGS